jgi:hypothetical protein
MSSLRLSVLGIKFRVNPFEIVYFLNYLAETSTIVHKHPVKLSA